VVSWIIAACHRLGRTDNRGEREEKVQTCAVRGGKYSKDHHILSSFSAFSIFWVIFMATQEKI
jgi:hypothetical protein